MKKKILIIVLSLVIFIAAGIYVDEQVKYSRCHVEGRSGSDVPTISECTYPSMN